MPEDTASPWKVSILGADDNDSGLTSPVVVDFAGFLPVGMRYKTPIANP
jgi:hypothetical protein